MPIYIDTNEIRGKLKLNGEAQAFLTATIAKHMDKYVPYKYGNLRTQRTLTPTTITYEMPYAHAQYVGFTKGPVLHYTTPGTGHHWDKRMLNVETDKIKKELVDFMLSRRGY